jgi:ribosomal protein S18 acetylase RimI-like enzyme
VNIEIRPASAEDVASVAALLRESFADELFPYMVYAQHGIADYLAIVINHPAALPHNHYLVAVDRSARAERVVGFAEFKTLPASVGFLSYVCVDPAVRRRGVARVLFQDFLVRHPDIRTVELDVFHDNRPAVAMYTRLGFTRKWSSEWMVRSAPVAGGAVEIPALAEAMASHRAYGFSRMQVRQNGTSTEVGRIGATVMRCFDREAFECPALHAGIVGQFPEVREVLAILQESDVQRLAGPYRSILTSDRMVGLAAAIRVRL